MRIVKLVVLGVVLIGTASAVQGSVVTYVTPTGYTLSGLPVDASVTFTLSDGAMTIDVSNLVVDPVGIIQNVSSVQFGVDVDLAGVALVSSSCTERTVDGDGTYAAGASVSTGWMLSVVDEQLVLMSALGSGQPKRTVIGAPDADDVYGSANGSIAGNEPHNPFAAETATFTVSLPALKEDSRLNNMALGFGTVPGTYVPVPVPVPEPATLSLLALGGLGLLARRRRK